MDVSHFELVFKPQSPVPPADTVLQGYFLKITNLESVEYSYALDFVTTSVTNPDRSLFANTVVFVDRPGSNNAPGTFSLTGGATADTFRLNPVVNIPANGTALVAVLPSDPFGPGGFAGTPNFECRGYVRLRLPPVFRTRPGSGGFRFEYAAQSDRPVRVMLTPQNRATYLSGSTIKDQTQATLPTANGAAVNLLTPQQPFALDLTVQFDRADLFRLNDRIGALDLTPDLLAGIMAQIEAGGADLTRLNAVMADAGIGLALERRKVAAEKKPVKV